MQLRTTEATKNKKEFKTFPLRSINETSFSSIYNSNAICKTHPTHFAPDAIAAQIYVLKGVFYLEQILVQSHISGQGRAEMSASSASS